MHVYVYELVTTCVCSCTYVYVCMSENTPVDTVSVLPCLCVLNCVCMHVPFHSILQIVLFKENYNVGQA